MKPPSHRAGLVTLVALGAVCALWARWSAPQGVEPSPTPALSASPATSVSPMASATPLALATPAASVSPSALAIPTGPVAISVRHLWGGCGYADARKLEWRAQDERYVSAAGSFDKARLSQLRELIAHTKQKCDGVHGLGDPPRAAEITGEIRRLYPWVQSPLPKLDDQALLKELRQQTLHGAVEQTTNHNSMTIVIEGSPRLELTMDDDFEAGMWALQDTMRRLPRWKIRADSQAEWSTSCADLSLALLPLLPKESRSELEVGRYFSEFVKMKARQIGDRWARRDAVESFRLWPGYQRAEGHAKVASLDIDWYGARTLVLQLQDNPNASRASFESGPDQRFINDWGEMMSRVAEVDRALERQSWLGSARRRYAYQFPASDEAHWPCLDLAGQPMVEVVLDPSAIKRNQSSPLLFLGRDGTTVLQYATPTMRKALGIPETARDYATYLMSPEGRPKRVKSNVMSTEFDEEGRDHSVEDDLEGG